MTVNITLAQAAAIYEHHYGGPIPSVMPYADAAAMVMEAIGAAAFKQLCNDLTSFCTNYHCAVHRVLVVAKICPTCGEKCITLAEGKADPDSAWYKFKNIHKI